MRTSIIITISCLQSLMSKLTNTLLPVYQLSKMNIKAYFIMHINEIQITGIDVPFDNFANQTVLNLINLA